MKVLILLSVLSLAGQIEPKESDSSVRIIRELR